MFRHRGDFKNIEKFLTKASNSNVKEILDKYGAEGVQRLSDATPKDSGLTAQSWGFGVKQVKEGYELFWYNTNIIDDVPIVLVLQYGHGTASGKYIPGRDFINPAIGPILDKLSDELWKEVTQP